MEIDQVRDIVYQSIKSFVPKDDIEEIVITDSLPLAGLEMDSLAIVLCVLDIDDICFSGMKDVEFGEKVHELENGTVGDLVDFVYREISASA